MEERPPRVWEDTQAYEEAVLEYDRPPRVWGRPLSHLRVWRLVGRVLLTLHELVVLIRVAAWRGLSVVVRPEAPGR